MKEKIRTRAVNKTDKDRHIHLPLSKDVKARQLPNAGHNIDNSFFETIDTEEKA